MTCERCAQWLEDLFDGAEPDAALVDHLVACSSCRELYESAVALRKGLALMPRPEPPPELPGRIVSAVLFDRRQRQNRRRIVSGIAAFAAAVLIALFATQQKPQIEKQPDPTVVDRDPPSLRKALTQAGSDVVESARQQWSEALSRAGQLVPPVESPMPPSSSESALEPTIRPLREAGQGAAASLEPVTGTARRAFALFVRDLSPHGKPGL